MLLVLADISAADLRDACGSDPDAVCRWVLERTDNRTLAEISDVVVGAPLTIVLIALGALLVNRLVGRVIERGLRSLSSGIVRERMSAVRRRTPGALLQTPETSLRAEQRILALTSILRSVAGFVILLLASFTVLSELGVNVAPLLAGAGVVGVALGFGSQSLVKDFLSGLFILAEDQFGVGDVVDLDGEVAGTVEAVSLRTTRLRSADGTVWHVPNGAIVRVGNKSQHWSRALLDVEVAADTDIDHAEHVIQRVASAVFDERADILEQPEVRGIEKRGEDAVAIRLLVKTLPSDRDTVGCELLRRLMEEFAREGIRMPAVVGSGGEGEGGPRAGGVGPRAGEVGSPGDEGGPPRDEGGPLAGEGGSPGDGGGPSGDGSGRRAGEGGSPSDERAPRASEGGSPSDERAPRASEDGSPSDAGAPRAGEGGSSSDAGGPRPGEGAGGEGTGGGGAESGGEPSGERRAASGAQDEGPGAGGGRPAAGGQPARD